MNGLTRIPAAYDYRLVALSVVVAILASYAALDLAGRVTATRGWARLAWLRGGASVMGVGIWSMDCTGMAAASLYPTSDISNTSHAVSISILGAASIIIFTFVVLGVALLI